MAFSGYHQFLSLQASQAQANLAMFEAMHPAPPTSRVMLSMPPAGHPGPPRHKSMLLLGDYLVEEIPPMRLPVNVYCRAVNHQYHQLTSSIRTTPDLRQDIDDAHVIVLAYGRDDLECQVPSSLPSRSMPIPSRTVAMEALEAIREMRSTSCRGDLQIYCMEAIPMLGWTGERRLAAGMLLDQIVADPSCDGAIPSAWCPDAFIQLSGELTPQGYKAWAQQLQTLMWRIQGCPAW